MNTVNIGTSNKEWRNIITSAIDTHCHGIGQFDFTEIHTIALQEIEDLLAQRNHHTVLTMYLPENNFDDFINLLAEFNTGRQAGKFKHIMGFGLEGPLLASHGGTPRESVWQPSKRQWKALANCGRNGLVYIIFSPDVTLDPMGSSSQDSPITNISWLTETLLDGGVMPAAGHFKHDDPLASAKALQTVYDVVASAGCGATMTDHLYNDMPHNFKHAWRTKAERAHLSDDLAAIKLESWSLQNLEEKLGPVPATMIRNAQRGVVKIAQNFDGEHVNLSIVKRTIDLLGAENMMMMTDSIESKRLGGEALHQEANSSLLYQKDNIVAAGSQGIEQQISNMFSMGLTIEQIKLLAYQTFSNLLKQHTPKVTVM